MLIIAKLSILNLCKSPGYAYGSAEWNNTYLLKVNKKEKIISSCFYFNSAILLLRIISFTRAFNQIMIVSTIWKQVQCKLTKCFLDDGNIGLKLVFAAKGVNFPGHHHTPLQELRKILTLLKISVNNITEK